MLRAVLLRANGESVFCKPETVEEVRQLLKVPHGQELKTIPYGASGVLIVRLLQQNDVGVAINRNATTIAKKPVRGDAVAFPYGLMTQNAPAPEVA